MSSLNLYGAEEVRERCGPLYNLYPESAIVGNKNFRKSALMNELLIATNNLGKLAEFGRLLDGVPVSLRDLSYYGITDEVDETGETFAENASIKAAFYARLGGSRALADDSGLVIDHLNGEPGVRSARYAGENASDRERIAKVLAQMGNARDRSARFVCVCALADTSGKIVHTTEGVCEGSIAEAPRGANGFGYDPLFIPAGFDKTFGEFSADIKHSISHRALAVKKMIPFLQGFFKI
jgi:XTP/dITP diphosphohydrolase